MNQTTVVLAENHRIVRQGVRALLEANPKFSVVGEAGNGVEAVRLVEQLKPNALVLDLQMPGLNGLEAARQIQRRSPQTRVIILTMHANEAYVFAAFQNGALGYVLKDSASDDLITAITEAMAGRRYLSAPLSDSAIEAYLQKTKASPVDRYETLTAREREILQLAAESNTNAEIGRRLFISPRTVEIHRTNMMRKLNLRTHTDLVRYALQRGLLAANDDPLRATKQRSARRG
ncbi:MAG: response regulator transcription factor [Verrucomicrobia bacterium]|nr:response regulator transcription factor [Verrucomicrobiota bacterium]